MTRPRQSALDVFISELEQFDGVTETLAGRKRLLRVLKQARKDAEDRKRLDWLSDYENFDAILCPLPKPIYGPEWRTWMIELHNRKFKTLRLLCDAAMEQK